MIDWDTPGASVSKFFTVKDCLYLPRWNRMATAEDGLTDEIKQNLLMLCIKMDGIRQFFDAPMIPHCVYRPFAYNALVGGAKNSPHMQGKAMDYHISGLDCDYVRGQLMDKLELWGLRMEDLPGSGWVHNDVAPVINSRFFKP